MRSSRSLTALLAALTLLVLTACGGGTSGTGSAAPVSLPAPQDAAQAFLDGEVFSETLEELDLDTAYRLYALEDYSVAREDLTGGAVYLSAGATAEEVAVLTFSSDDLAAGARDALLAHIEAQKESYADYLPDEIPKLDAATVIAYGSTLVLVVPANGDNAAAVSAGFAS